MERFLYPCNITEEDGVFYVDFFDFDACFTDGETLEEALVNAKEVLTLVLIEKTSRNDPLPEPSKPEAKDGFIVFVDVLKSYVYSKANSQAVKKTLTIPKWLNDMAMAENINFSKVLQEALQTRLHV